MVIAESSGTAMLTAAMDGISANVTVRVAPRAAHDLIYNRWSGAASELFVLGLAGNSTVPARINAGNVSREPSPSPDGSQVVLAVSQPAVNGETLLPRTRLELRQDGDCTVSGNLIVTGSVPDVPPPAP